MGAIINLIVLVPFLIFAFMLSKGKGASLLAGYNTMSDSKKDQYDEVTLCKFMSKIMYGICFSIALNELSEILENNALFIIGLSLLFSLLVFALVYLNTGNRFKKDS